MFIMNLFKVINYYLLLLQWQFGTLAAVVWTSESVKIEITSPQNEKYVSVQKIYTKLARYQQRLNLFYIGMWNLRQRGYLRHVNEVATQHTN